jgi:molybdopterin-guanine dinucleotide biosynthesis protein A
LPVHGFVLAGGKSSRMGKDKSLLRFSGRPMVEIAVEKLREFCAAVSIVGNREDLTVYASVVQEERIDCGPGAGIEAGLKAETQGWALFLPVDVPLVPVELLRNWMQAVLGRAEAGCIASFLLVNQERQPAFCALRRSTLPDVAMALDRGERRLADILWAVDDADRGWLWLCSAEEVAPLLNPTRVQMESWFSNINTPQNLAEAEAWAASYGERL